jgi:alpha-N-arabinofuranosidase
VPVPHVQRIYATAARDDNSGEIIIKVVNPTGEPADSLVQLKGAAKIAGKINVTTLSGSSLADENSLTEPKKVAPVISSIGGAGAEFKFTFKPWSLTVLRIAAAKN